MIQSIYKLSIDFKNEMVMKKFITTLLVFITLLTICIISPIYAEDYEVYITKTGAKYHLDSCSYLRNSKILITLSDALSQGYGPCSRCKPPTEYIVAAAPLLEPKVLIPEKEDIAIPYFEAGSEVHFHTGFTLQYSEEHEQSLWVAYLLTDDEVNGTIGRTDNFRADKDIVTGSASLSDYRGSGFDRGHLAPAGDMKWSKNAMSESFFMSNMSPQVPGFNRGIWKKLEEWVRDQADHDEEVYVVTGPILTDGPYETIGDNEVSIPKHYFKVILDIKEPDIKAIGFILPNESSGSPLSSFVVTIDHIETISGLDFFYLLDNSLEESLESGGDFSKWN